MTKNRYITPEDYGAKGDGKADDTAFVQTAINAWMQSDKPLIFHGDYRITAPLIAKPFGNISRTKVMKFEGGALIDDLGNHSTLGNLLEFSVRNTGFLWRNLHVHDAQFLPGENPNAQSQMLIDGGDEGVGGGYEALYSFDIIGTVIADAPHNGITIYGDAFEGQLTGGRIESRNKNGFGIKVGGGGHNNTSSLYFDKFTVYGFDVGIFNDSSDLRCTNLTVLVANRWGIYYSNNIGGTVQNCHVENNWMGEDIGPGIQLSNVVRAFNNFGLSNEGGQVYVVGAYSQQEDNVIVGGFNLTGTTTYAKLKGDGTYTLIGVPSYDADHSVTVNTVGPDVPSEPNCDCVVRPQFNTRWELIKFLINGK